MPIIAWIWCIGLGMVLCTTLFNFLTAPMLKNGPAPKFFPKVSILIPARNEEHNLPNGLGRLILQDYPSLEICVLDDHSSDNTSAVVMEWRQKYPQIKLLKGKTLPYGWTGKNWACQQLGETATGDILIFTDADNIYSKDAVSKTIGWMQKLELHFFSAFPQQVYRSLAEKLVGTSIYMTVYSYLPLWLTWFIRFSSLAAANGQWLAMTKYTWNKLGGHTCVKGEVVEDTAMSRLAKAQGFNILTTSGQGAVTGAMYQGFHDVWQGFSKNMFGLMDYQIVPFILLLAFMLTHYVLPYLLLGFTAFQFWAGLAVGINLLIRILIAIKYKEPFWSSVFLHPFAILLTVIIGINSLRWYQKGFYVWKGRQLPFHK